MDFRQGELFDGGQPRHIRERDDQRADGPAPYTGALSHEQFEYDSCAAIFGGRGGWGPLVLGADTSVLIDLVKHFDDVDSTFGFAGEHLALLAEPGDRIGSLRALFILWFWRDVRFYVPQRYRTDTKSKALTADQEAERERIMQALNADLYARGGVERSGTDALGEAGPRCWDHDDERDRRVAAAAGDRIEALVAGNDGGLASEAAAAGAHVFLTEDIPVRKRSERLRAAAGIVALAPGEVLAALDDAGELEPKRMSNGGLAPDLLSFSHFYALAPED